MYKERVHKRANYELVRGRPLRVATNKRPGGPFCCPPLQPRRPLIVPNDRRYTPSRDLSAADEEENRSFPVAVVLLLLLLLARPSFSPPSISLSLTNSRSRVVRFFVGIRLAFDLGGRERRASARGTPIPVRSPGPVLPDFPGPRRARARIKCRSYLEGPRSAAFIAPRRDVAADNRSSPFCRVNHR